MTGKRKTAVNINLTYSREYGSNRRGEAECRHHLGARVNFARRPMEER